MKLRTNLKKAGLAVIALSSLLLFSCATTDVKKGKALKNNPDVKTGVLENGMSYYVQKNSKPENRIELRLVVRTGSTNEEDDQQGVAHFVEHLAFNGTEHFEKNSLIKYFESIGMDFGADMNAYTSFNETVFNLTVPADNPEYLENALLIFHDWASAITFDPEEIEKERGVVTEEWRGKQGIGWRILKKKLPMLCKDSVYADRLPIGQMDVIKNVSRERIVDYYEKWYRPELMSVAVVGDADESYLIQKIKDAMESIPASDVKASPSVFLVPEAEGKQSLYFADKEETDTEITIAGQVTPATPELTEEDFKNNVALSMVAVILNQRFNKINLDPKSPWQSASVVNKSIADNCLNYGLYVCPKEGREEEAFSLLLDECDRITGFGVTNSEMKDAATYMLQNAKEYYNNEENHYSSSLVRGIVNCILDGSVNISGKDNYALMQKTVRAITQSDLQKVIDEYFADRGKYLMVLVPESRKSISEKKAYELWTEYRNENLVPYEEEELSDSLMDRPAIPGTVVSKTVNDYTGAAEYVLSNGIHVLYKKTNFEKNYFNYYIVSRGGESLVSDEDYPSNCIAGTYAWMSGISSLDYTQLQKYFADKDYSFNFSTSSITERFNGRCHNDKENMESMMQMVYLFMNEPKFNADTWSVIDQSLQTQAKNFGSSPNEVFWKKVRDEVYRDIRHASLDLDFYSRINRESAERLYRERYCNPLDYEYIFTGDVDEKTLLNLVQTYFGSIDTEGMAKETYRNITYPFKKGIIENTVVKGQEDKGYVDLEFGAPAESVDREEGYRKDLIMEALTSVLDTRLREVLREDAGGTYGVGVDAYFDGLDDSQFVMEIYFGCDQNREKELVDLALAELNSIVEKGIDPSYIDSFKETWKRNRETNLKDNGSLGFSLAYKYLYGFEDPYLGNIDFLDELITPETVHEYAAKYIHTDNYIVTYLRSEKGSSTKSSGVKKAAD